MAARHCTKCLTDWPPTTEFSQCADCQLPTAYRGQRTPEMTIAEGHSRQRRARFNRFYDEWEAKREQRGEPSPEAQGRLEAREQTRLIRKIAAGLEEVPAG